MSTVKVLVKPEVEVMARLEILNRVAYALVLGFGGEMIPESHLEILRKGIELKAFQKILLHFFDHNKIQKCEVNIKIDWTKHQCSASSDDGTNLFVDPDASIFDQLSRIYHLLVQHVEKLRKQFCINKITMHFELTDEIYADKQKTKEMRKKLGLVETKPITWKNHSNKPPEIFAEFICKELAELGTSILHHKN